jgi:hypothetical protein
VAIPRTKLIAALNAGAWQLRQYRVPHGFTKNNQSVENPLRILGASCCTLTTGRDERLP